MYRFLLLSLLLVSLLAGCSAPKDTNQSSEESENLGTYFEDEPADNEMGSAEFGLQDPMDTVYTYNGEPLEIPFSITGATSGRSDFWKDYGDRCPPVCGWSGPTLFCSL